MCARRGGGLERGDGEGGHPKRPQGRVFQAAEHGLRTNGGGSLESKVRVYSRTKEDFTPGAAELSLFLFFFLWQK